MTDGSAAIAHRENSIVRDEALGSAPQWICRRGMIAGRTIASLAHHDPRNGSTCVCRPTPAHPSNDEFP
jgi:hypothetical protein